MPYTYGLNQRSGLLISMSVLQLVLQTFVFFFTVIERRCIYLYHLLQDLAGL